MPNRQFDAKNCLSPRQAADALNLRIEHIYRLCAAGRLGSFRSEEGRRWLTRDSVEAWRRYREARSAATAGR